MMPIVGGALLGGVSRDGFSELSGGSVAHDAGLSAGRQLKPCEAPQNPMKPYAIRSRTI